MNTVALLTNGREEILKDDQSEVRELTQCSSFNALFVVSCCLRSWNSEIIKLYNIRKIFEQMNIYSSFR